MTKSHFTWDTTEAFTKLQEGLAEGNRDAAQQMLDLANDTVPVETGFLRDSGGVSVDPEGMDASVYYDAPYAGLVHEEDREHPQGRSKWLQLTFEENPQVVLEAQAKGLQEHLK